MKKYFVACLILIIFWSSVCYSGIETNAVFSKVMQASNDEKGMIAVLPEIEGLWPQEPESYFESANQAAHTLGSSMKNIEAQESLQKLFTNLLAKPLPSDDVMALNCIDKKVQIIGYCLNYETISSNKFRWVEIARFVGELRTRMAINTNSSVAIIQSVANPSSLSLNASNEHNDRVIYINKLTERMRSADLLLSRYLIGASQKILRTNPNDTNFIHWVISSAHLSADEIKMLN